MLIHVTRFTAVQSQVAEQVRDELGELKSRLKYGDGNSPTQLIDELEELWDQDFVPTSGALADPDIQSIDFAQIREVLSQAAARIDVMTINGTAKDALTYYEHPRGLSVIAIGGDKLSRGLTLEGLSVSYYLRASKMYDTLMQMGRWFGYRPGYLDLCRLYTTGELRDWYRDITAANQELLNMFDHMAAVGGTPEDFGLKVRSHPDGLLITAPAKMRHGKKLQLSFASTISETIAFHRDPAIIQANFELVERLIGQLDEKETAIRSNSGDYLWARADASQVVWLFEGIITHESARRAQGPLLARYVRSRVDDGELLEWTVALISNKQAARKSEVAGHGVGLVTRQSHPGPSDRYTIRRLVSPRDEALDLTEEEQSAALARTQEAWRRDPGRSRRKEPPDIPSGQIIREMRSPRKGLLLLYPLDPSETNLEDSPPIVGFAVSFPHSAHTATIEYVVTNTYWNEELGIE